MPTGTSTKPASTSGTTPRTTLTAWHRRSPSHPQRPPHPVFDGSSSSYRATHRTHGVSLDRRRKRAAPSRPKRGRVLEHMHRGRTARFVSRGRTPGAGVVTAFRRGEQDVNLTHPSPERRYTNVLQPAGYDVSLREVCRERGRGDRTHVDSGHHFNPCRTSADAAAACPTENVTRPYHGADAPLVVRSWRR